MIASHAHKFIFVKTRKVAGTSVEVFLSQFCGEQDVITPLGHDEALREGKGGQNYWFSTPGRGNRLLRLWGEIVGQPSIGYRGYYPHMPAKEIRRLVGERLWSSYFKFTIERNPWDRQVSLYHWHYRKCENKPSFDLFIRSPFHRKISSNFGTYAIDGEIAVDYVCRYETLEEDLRHVLREIGIDADVDLAKAKSGYRSERDWREYYTPRTRDIVGRWYAREIEAFGFSF